MMCIEKLESFAGHYTYRPAKVSGIINLKNCCYGTSFICNRYDSINHSGGGIKLSGFT